MIESLLIANRGEIARRIIRTARRLGVRTIAVYSDADASAPHVSEADEAVHIGPSPARESYLVPEKILAAARQTGAAAIHPGYGFLSENAAFAQAVIDAGLIWVGPPPAAIDAMGLKDAAKKRMADAGVPVTPGYLGEDQTLERLQREADAIGYPVLIKAVAGGGGKGMRKVLEAGAFADALASCQREAAASFGDDRVLIEKYVTRPRHIEVQVFGDRHGNVVHLFERDCSLQRRHQKVIEEAPAPGMDEATRKAVCDAAVLAARAVNYEGAGTIEFIADASEGLRADRIWFMEMNTRLQVEHPVTEMITGQDLVEWQLRVASGEPLPLKQEELSIDGWAMEARLYAENPATGFLPSTGRLDHLYLPASQMRGDDQEDDANPDVYRDTQVYGSTRVVNVRSTRLVTVQFEGEDGALTQPEPWAELGPWWPLSIRVDSAVEEGGEVSPFYDPMIAKLIVHGPDRAAAAKKLARVCRSIEVWPVKTNAGFLANCAADPDFIGGAIDTGFIEARIDSLIETGVPARVVAAALTMKFDDLRLRGDVVRRDASPVWETIFGANGFRLNAPPATADRVWIDGAVFEGDVMPTPNGYWTVTVGREQFQTLDNGWRTIRFKNGDELRRLGDPSSPVLLCDGSAYRVAFTYSADAAAASASDGAILSPMPGKIVSVSVKAGDAVTKGQTLLVLEAMKMEHAMAAPFDGVVAELSAEAGGQVSEGVVLARLDPA